jgi:hypothetical protein
LSAREILRRFSSEAEAGTSELAHHAVLYTLTRSSASATQARRDSIADGLVDQALFASGLKTRIGAASYLTLVGSAEREVALPDAVQRVARVLRSSRDREVREMILITAFKMKDRRTLVPVLSEVAREPENTSPHNLFNNHDLDAATHAIVALARMGEEGRAALRGLHQRREVRSQRAASALENLSRRGFSPE